jgi:hypothetical protein
MIHDVIFVNPTCELLSSHSANLTTTFLNSMERAEEQAFRSAGKLFCPE